MNRFLLLLLVMVIASPAYASRVLTDEAGRTVTVPDHPHRIISLLPSITDDLFALGAADDVVAVSNYTKYPVEATKKPSVGSTMTPSMETILSFHPDLVIGQVRYNQQGSLDAIARLGIPVFLIDPHGIAGILHSLSTLGVMLGREMQAKALVISLTKRIDAVRARVQGKPVVRVFWAVSYDPVITMGKGAFTTELIATAGGRSVTDDLTEEWPHISMEVVLQRAPDALLLEHHGKITLDVLKTRPGWSALPAVIAGRVYYLDDRFSLTSPVSIDALEDVARQFHPLN